MISTITARMPRTISDVLSDLNMTVPFACVAAAALLAIPVAGALQVLVKEVWQATAPHQPQEAPAPAAESADESGNPAAHHRQHPTAQDTT
jgi:hypothetical protein